MPYRQRLFKKTYSGGLNNFFPMGSVTTDDLRIYPNMVDLTSSIKLYGTGGLELLITNGGSLYIYHGSANTLNITYATPDVLLSTLVDKNLFLKPSGTGKIKVAGTATGTGDVAINGHYDILDENGATIKLATVA